VKTPLKLAVLALASFGAYMLWKQFGSRLLGRGNIDPRVSERAELTADERSVGSDNPVAQAAAILTESDERADLLRDADGIERRRSEDTVEP
jgi:hypothetical protein